MGFILRTERLPIIEVEYPPTLDETEYRDLFATYCSLSVEHGRVAYIIDMRSFHPLTVSVADRKLAAQIFREHASYLVPATVCEARLVSTPLTQGILTAFDWLTGTKWPCRTFTSPDEAEVWVQQLLADDRL
jgi:hypothetical protein